jgi:hypothetical protein
MPYWGLILTSVGFALPAWVARRKRKRRFAKACNTLALTSVLYHGTTHPICCLMDRIYAHGFCTLALIHCVYMSLREKHWKKLGAVTSSAIPLYLYFAKSQKTDGLQSKLWHMTFHITGQGCLTAYSFLF